MADVLLVKVAKVYAEQVRLLNVCTVLEILPKSRQRFTDAIVLTSASDWLEKLSNFENVPEMPFESGL